MISQFRVRDVSSSICAELYKDYPLSAKILSRKIGERANDIREVLRLLRASGAVEAVKKLHYGQRRGNASWWQLTPEMRKLVNAALHARGCGRAAVGIFA